MTFTTISDRVYGNVTPPNRAVHARAPVVKGLLHHAKA